MSPGDQCIYARDNLPILLMPPASAAVIDQGSNALYTALQDPLDIDGDTNTGETSPYDLSVLCANNFFNGSPRVRNSDIDMGAWETDDGGCAADFNNSGILEIADVFAFINAWFGGCTTIGADPCHFGSADFNGGGLATSDIFDFLNAWFAGCS